MLKKLLLISFALVFVANFVNAGPRLTKAQLDKISRIQYKITVVGDAVVGKSVGNTHIPGSPSNSSYGPSPISLDGWISTKTFVFTGCNSIYDLCSNGSPDQVIQDPNAPDKIHAVFVQNPAGDPSFANRRSKYYYSTNRGVSWSFVSDVPNGVRSGYPTIRLFSDGTEIISNHSGAGTPTTVRTQWFKDAFAGLGSFTRLDHPYNTGVGYIWPRFACSNSITSTNKFVDVSSINGQDTAVWTSCTNFSTGTGTFSPWTTVLNCDQAETYKVAYGADGRCGIAFVASGSQTSIGSIYYMVSTNGGTSFSAATKIYNCSFTGDSLGGLRGISLVFIGNSPKVVFETIKQTTAGSFFPGEAAKIRFWSDNLPGTDPNRSIVIADTSMVGYHPYISGGTSNDVFGSLCRPTIGKCVNDKVLFVAFAVPFGIRTGEVYVGGSPDTNAFMSVYMTASGDSGKSWKTCERITSADTINIFDWPYPSMSPTNDWNSTNNTLYANMTVFKDSVPGSYVNHAANGESPNAGYYFIRVAIPGLPGGYIGVGNISSEIPNTYSLSQNYPNPFNPVTLIQFALPKTSNVTLKVYNINGQLVETLVNNETVKAGVNEVKFDASKLASGIYFYSIQAGSFKETKKMMLIK